LLSRSIISAQTRETSMPKVSRSCNRRHTPSRQQHERAADPAEANGCGFVATLHGGGNLLVQLLLCAAPRIHHQLHTDRKRIDLLG
jgi:hypothetical protein